MLLLIVLGEWEAALTFVTPQGIVLTIPQNTTGMVLLLDLKGTSRMCSPGIGSIDHHIQRVALLILTAGQSVRDGTPAIQHLDTWRLLH